MISAVSYLLLSFISFYLALVASSDKLREKYKRGTGDEILSVPQNDAIPTLSLATTGYNSSDSPSTTVSPTIQYIYGPLKITRSRQIAPTLQPTTSIPSAQPSFYSISNPRIIAYTSINYFQQLTTIDFPFPSPIPSKINLKNGLDILESDIDFKYSSVIKSNPLLPQSQQDSLPSSSFSPSAYFRPSFAPSIRPYTTLPNLKATYSPTLQPSAICPTQMHSSAIPTLQSSTLHPALQSSANPTFDPSLLHPTLHSTANPTLQPSSLHPNYMTLHSSVNPTLQPSSLHPTLQSSANPSSDPSFRRSTLQFSANPTLQPSSLHPTLHSSAYPILQPYSLRPTLHPSVNPTFKPSTSEPFAFHSAVPSLMPSALRSTMPSVAPSTEPTAVSSKMPSFAKPCSSFIPSKKLSALPSTKPSSRVPNNTPSIVPSAFRSPSQRPTERPTSNYPTPEPSAAPSLKSSAPSTVPSYSPSFTDLSYHNGSVMTGVVNLYNIYFGDFTSTPSDRPTPGLVDYFSQHIGNTSWFDTFSVFYEEKNGVRIPAASSSVLKASSRCNGVGKGLSIGMNDVISCIVSSFSNGVPDPNGIYAVIFRGDFTWNSDGLTWNTAPGSDFCGFHSTFVHSTNEFSTASVKFFVVGDPSIEKGNLNMGCIVTPLPTANGNIGADNLLTTYAHEIAECITNYNDDGWHIGQLETADLCNVEFGTKSNSNIIVGNKKFLIQQLYIPGRGCTMSLKSDAPTTSPAPSTAPTFAPFGGGSPGSNDDVTAVPVTLPTISPNLPSDISYHGGYTLGYSGSPIPICNVFIGKFSPSTINLMNYFAENIGNTSWFDILHSYYDFDYYGQQIFVYNQTIFKQSVSLSPPSQHLTDLDIQTLLYNAITYNLLDQDMNSVYSVMFPGYFNVTVNGKSWLKDWCSYHGSFAFGETQILKYSVVGDPSSAPGTSGQVCEPVTGRPTANGDLAADSMAVGFAQQLANTITDFEGAWYSDQSGLEVSSLCNGDFGPGVKVTGPQGVNSNIVVGDRKFLVQSLWKPAVGCRMSYLTE